MSPAAAWPQPNTVRQADNIDRCWLLCKVADKKSLANGNLANLLARSALGWLGTSLDDLADVIVECLVVFSLALAARKWIA